jgi:hypothetical protein
LGLGKVLEILLKCKDLVPTETPQLSHILTLPLESLYNRFIRSEIHLHLVYSRSNSYVPCFRFLREHLERMVETAMVAATESEEGAKELIREGERDSPNLHKDKFESNFSYIEFTVAI